MLFAGDRDCEIEIVNILPYEKWLFVVILLGVRVDNGNLCPLRLVEAHLEQTVASDDAQYKQCAQTSTTCVKRLFTV